MDESGRLFDVDGPAPPEERDETRPEGVCVSVVVEVAAVEHALDYVVPPRHAADLTIGAMVRVPLGPRRVRGWVVAIDVDPPPGIRLVEVTKVSGRGPDPEIIDLCRWATWRWVGRLPGFLGTASPPTMVRRLPRPAEPRRGPAPSPDRVAAVATDLVASPRTVLRAAPTLDLAGYVAALPVAGDLLVVCPTQRVAEEMGEGLRRHGLGAAMWPDGWARAAAGATVVGTRSAVFAPMPRLGAIVIVDEHDAAHQNEGSPTWHSRELAFERGRRRRVPVVATSPLPTADVRRHARLVLTDRASERAGWARLEVVDRRDEDRSRTGAFSPGLVAALSGSARALVILNRKGRSALLACRACRALAACDTCGAAVRLEDRSELACPRCGAVRPMVCASCGGTGFAQRRWGVTRLRDDLETLLRRPVAELTASGRRGPDAAAVVVGTEAALRRSEACDLVAFIEFDQELLAPRYRAGEEALGLLAQASRIVGGRDGGRVLVQTTEVDHEVIAAAVHADPALLSAVDDERRRRLGLPPFGTVVAVGGTAAAEFVARLGRPDGVTVQRVPEEGWLVRSDDREALLGHLGSIRRPAGRLRLLVDPVRLPFG